MAEGHAVTCHNAVRDFIYMKCCVAGLRPEREEPGLLPDDPRRRPGDLFFSVWPGGAAVAKDFAVTSPLQHSERAGASQTQLFAATVYENKEA